MVKVLVESVVVGNKVLVVKTIEVFVDEASSDTSSGGLQIQLPNPGITGSYGSVIESMQQILRVTRTLHEV